MAAETKTEAKKERKKSKSREGNALSNALAGVRTYLGEVRSELNKVSWPERPDVIRLTRIVLIVTIASGLVLGALSIGFSYLIEFGIEREWIFVILFAAIIGGTIYMFRRDSQKVGY